jgi:DNA-binding FadR family transcriptional regulator
VTTAPTPRQPNLESIKAMPLKKQVVERLRAMIDEGGYRDGDQLPSERALSEALHVSRGTLREAVQFLQAMGLLEIRHGTGTFVRVPGADSSNVRDEWREWTARHSDTINHLLEVRMGLDAHAAELAAKRATADHLDRMAEVLAEMEADDGTDPSVAVHADVAFHRLINEATANPALLELADELGNRLITERAAILDVPGRHDRSINEHRAIYEAIRDGDGTAARLAVIAHLRSVEHDVAALVSQHGTEGPS